METIFDKCPGYPDPTLFFFSSEVPPFLYYSHIPSILLALAFALFIGKFAKGSIGRWFLIGALVSYALWVLSILVTWTNNIPSVISFFWAIYGSLYALVAIFLVAFIYSFSFQRFPSFWLAALVVTTSLPIFLLAPTTHNVFGFDINLCGVGEFEGTAYVNYYYFYGLALALLGILITWRAYFVIEQKRRRQVLLVGIGAFLGTVTMFSSSYLATALESFWLEKFGLLGLPVFLGYLTFAIVKYRAMDVRLISAQVLVALLLFLNFSILFIRKIENARTIVVATIVLTLIFGRYLVRGVEKEIEQRQRIGRLALELQSTNEQQTNLMHFITHQIKGFFTKSRNIASMILDGDFGKFDPEVDKMLRMSIENDERGVALVQELLNATNLKRGTVQYNMVEADMRDLVREAYEMVELTAKAKNMKYELAMPEAPVAVRCDTAFVKQSIRNVIDNAVKYTPEGSVLVRLDILDGFAVVRIIDTGIGFSTDDRAKLFTEGGRAAGSRKVNVESTGYGLYIVKNVIEQHGGRVDATSDGVGKGATFTLALPIVS